MNPGYLSWLLMVVSMILFASGWKDVLIRGITSKGILLFFVSWLAGMNFSLAIPGGRVAVWVLILIVVICCVLWRIEGVIPKLHVISVGILLGSVSFFMQETIFMMPSLLLKSPEISMALFIALLAVVSIKLPTVQLASVSIGLLLGETYFRYVHRKHIGLEFGSLVLQDRWWLTIYVTRFFSIMMSYLLIAGKHSTAGIAAVIKSGLRKKWAAGTKKGS